METFLSRRWLDVDVGLVNESMFVRSFVQLWLKTLAHISLILSNDVFSCDGFNYNFPTAPLVCCLLSHLYSLSLCQLLPYLVGDFKTSECTHPLLPVSLFNLLLPQQLVISVCHPSYLLCPRIALGSSGMTGHIHFSPSLLTLNSVLKWSDSKSSQYSIPPCVLHCNLSYNPFYQPMPGANISMYMTPPSQF